MWVPLDILQYILTKMALFSAEYPQRIEAFMMIIAAYIETWLVVQLGEPD